MTVKPLSNEDVWSYVEVDDKTINCEFFKGRVRDGGITHYYGEVRLKELFAEYERRLGNEQVRFDNKDWHIGVMWGINKSEMILHELFGPLLK